MARWIRDVLARIATLATARKIAFTLKAHRELASLGLGLDPDDARDVLMSLTASDSAGRLESNVTGEWMYIFKPRVAMSIVYVKVILRSDCVIVSFHGDEGAGDD